MNLTEEIRAQTQLSSPEISLTTPVDRRADVEAKQARVSELLTSVGCDGLLVLEPENFGWLTAGGAARGVADPAASPCLYFTTEGRWVVCGNVDTQRLFDEELDGLGFQLKEWPWYLGRAQFLSELCQGRNLACDQPLAECKPLANELRLIRRGLSDYERACYRALGQILSHALEATGRTMTPGETEREIAGQLSHRLLHRGAIPVVISVAAEGRSRVYRQPGFTATPIRTSCVMTVCARKYGLCTTASRAVCFGQPEGTLRKDHEIACKVSATYIAGTWPDAMPRQILATGRHIYQISGFEHEWLLSPQGHVTGRTPVELPLTPHTEDLLQSNWAVTWSSTVGTAVSCDTFLISDEGPRAVTAAEAWPLKRIRIQGAEFVRPDVLIR
jgi:Xaa-Pro dipeptidase